MGWAMDLEMQTWLSLLAMVAAGIAAGVWSVRAGKARRAVEEEKAALEREAAALRERLDAREQRLLELQNASGTAAQEISRLRAALGEESRLRAAAEEKNTRIPELDGLSKAKEVQLAQVARGERGTAGEAFRNRRPPCRRAPCGGGETCAAQRGAPGIVGCFQGDEAPMHCATITALSWNWRRPYSKNFRRVPGTTWKIDKNLSMNS